jgi:hypothetical protein
LWQRTETFNIFVGCLHAMAQDLPKDTIGQRVRNIFSIQNYQTYIWFSEWTT